MPAFDDPDTPIVVETLLELVGLAGCRPDWRRERARIVCSRRTRESRDVGADFKPIVETALAFHPPEARTALRAWSPATARSVRRAAPPAAHLSRAAPVSGVRARCVRPGTRGPARLPACAPSDVPGCRFAPAALGPGIPALEPPR
jgi:hypothetical protein